MIFRRRKREEKLRLEKVDAFRKETGISEREAMKLNIKLLMMRIENLTEEITSRMKHAGSERTYVCHRDYIAKGFKEKEELILKGLAKIEDFRKKQNIEGLQGVSAKIKKMRAEVKDVRRKRLKNGLICGFPVDEFKEAGLFPAETRSANIEDYKKWFAGFLQNGGMPTGYYDEPFEPRDKWLVVEDDFELVPLYGTNSLDIIVLKGARFKGGQLGHTNLYFMGGFVNKGGNVPFYSDVKNLKLPGADEQKTKELNAKLEKIRADKLTEIKDRQAKWEERTRKYEENLFHKRVEKERERIKKMEFEVQRLLEGKTRPAAVEDYKKWLVGFLRKGGKPTHYYDYSMPMEDWLVATADFELNSLDGVILRIIVSKGVKFKGGDPGRSKLYFMDGFEKQTSWIPFYTDIEF